MTRWTAADLATVQQRTKRSKYGNVKVQIDGYTFDSKREAERYGELKLLAAARHIYALKVHVPYRLEVNGVHVANYECDFAYVDKPSGKLVIEDVKGVKTRDYVMKRKLMKAIYGIEIHEVR